MGGGGGVTPKSRVFQISRSAIYFFYIHLAVFQRGFLSSITKRVLSNIARAQTNKMADKEKIMKMTKMMVRSVVMSEKEGVLMDNLVRKLVLYDIFKCSVFYFNEEY